MPFTFPDGSSPGTCTVCGAKSWSPRSNKCEEHKPEQKPKTPRKRGRPSLNADGSPKQTAVKVIETAGAIDAKTFSGKPPSASEWEDKLTSLVILLTMTYVEYAVVRPTHLPEPHATEAVSQLGMTEDEARTIVEPCAYLLARSSINKKHGREALELLAFAPAVLAIIAWTDRVQSFRVQMQAQLGGPIVSPESTPTPEGAAPVANFGVGVWDASQAPTARVNGNRSHVDQQDRAVTA